jgi:hypothetical protein
MMDWPRASLPPALLTASLGAEAIIASIHSFSSEARARSPEKKASPEAGFRP